MACSQILLNLQACFMRGLNPYGLKKEEKESYLKSWTSISKEVDGKLTNFSLIQ